MTKNEKINVESIREMKRMQSDNLTDAYMYGLYNGLELALSAIESRDPIFKKYYGELIDDNNK